MKRKDFIYSAGVILGGSILGCKSKTVLSEKEREITFDLHTHPGRFFAKGTELYQGEAAFIKRVKDMNINRLNGAFFSIVADLPLLKRTATGIEPTGTFKNDEGWHVFKSQMATLKALLKMSKADIALDTVSFKNNNRVQVFIASEGGDFLDGKINRVEEAYIEGVRSIQLVHYAPNLLGDLQTWKAEHGGLSEFGKKVVRKMNQLGMVIDVAHASARTVKHVVDMTTAPVILSHSILKDGKGRPISARAISIDHAKMVAGTGGVIGMWPSGFSTSFDDFVDHSFKMIDAVGIDHVGIGTDMDSNYKPVITDYTGFVKWSDALSSRGLSKEEVDKIVGGNVVRVMKSIL